jgi:uncharacterized membrane protein
LATRQTRPDKAAPRSGLHRLRHRLGRVPRHGAFYIGLGVGVGALVAALLLVPAFAIAIGAIAMFVTYLVVVALTLPMLTPQFLKSHADDADTPAPVIFLVVIGVVAVCCGTLFMALNGRSGPALEEVLLSIVSVLLGWFVVHTMAALHYAYEYYELLPEGSTGLARGLDFPEGDNPDGMAFLYFAYVIGTAFAVSDIRVTSNKMRKIVMLHSTFSYFFNTLIVAATVNVAVAVGGV